MDSSFTTGYNIGLVSLPELDAPPPYGTNCVFAGWGRYGFKNDSCLLRWMEFEILEAAECKNKGRHLRNKGEICAIHDNEIAYTEPVMNPI
uniref:Peptidase S1 domain-containing protein n=1 Tax=Bracon brevicornis TaxID=1563983 RepID=A0A6V7L331_9HYME